MKKQLQILFIILCLFASCKKDESLIKESTNPKLSKQLMEGQSSTPARDPYVEYFFSNYNELTGKTHVKLQIEGGTEYPGAKFYLQYPGNGSKVIDFGEVGTGYETDIILPVGRWTFGMSDDGLYRESRPFSVKARPSAPPTGKLNLYRYYSIITNRHYYTTNWAGLGSNGDNYELEQVQGLLYDSPGTNRSALYEYYNLSTDDHWYTTTTNGWPGYVLQGPIGYISTVQTSEANVPLDEYYATATGHVYSSPPERLPTSYTLLGNVGYIEKKVDTSPVPIYLFYSPSQTDHFTTADPNAVSGLQGWAAQGSEFKAYITQVAGTVPVYEFYYPGDHYNSINRTAVAGFAGWSNYGIKYYAYSEQVPGTIPIYEFYHSGGGDHYLTPNPNIANLFSGWSNHGIAFYALPN
jgi:hypothetical protein